MTKQKLPPVSETGVRLDHVLRWCKAQSANFESVVSLVEMAFATNKSTTLTAAQGAFLRERIAIMRTELESIR